MNGRMTMRTRHGWTARGSRRWRITLGLMVLALAALGGSLLGRGSPAVADGLLVGCPEGPDTDITKIHGLGVVVTPDGASTPTISRFHPNDPDPANLNSMGSVLAADHPERRDLDTDADGTPDLRWNAQFFPDVTATNLTPLWARIGGSLDPGTTTGVRVSFERLAGDTSVAPFDVGGFAIIDFTTPPDPNIPGDTATTETKLISVDYDTRPTGAVAPNLASFDVVFQDAPPAQPDVGYLGARIATTYRTGGDPAAPVVAPGTEPALTTKVQVGLFLAAVDRDLDLNVGWDRAPAEFAFVDATHCAPPDPDQTMAWDYRMEQPGAAPATTGPGNAHVHLAIGKGEGVDGNPQFELNGQVDAIPEEMTLHLTETTAELRHGQHADSVQPNYPLPDLTIDQILITSVSDDPAEADTRLLLKGSVADLPPVTNLEVLTDPGTGDFTSADLRFCDGPTWASAACQATVNAPAVLGLSISDVLPGETSTLPPLSISGGSVIAYTQRDLDGTLVTNPEHHFRFGGRLPKLRHLHVSLPGGTTDGVKAEAQLTQSASSVALLVDTDTHHQDLGGGGQTVTTGSKLAFDGTIKPLGAHAVIDATDDNVGKLHVAYDFFGTKGTVGGKVTYRGNTADKALNIDGRVELGNSTTGMPSKADLDYKRATNGVSNLAYKPNAKTPVKAGLVISDSADRAKNRRQRLWADGMLGGSLYADWTTAPLVGLRSLEVRPCAALPCIASTPAVQELHGRVLNGAPITNELSSLLTAPDMPKLDHPELYPAFTVTPHGVTYVNRHDNTWGADVELAGLESLRYDDTGLAEGQKVCVQSDAAPSGTVDTRFGTRLFMGMVGKRSGKEPEQPIYVDGVLAKLPTALDVRINDEGSAADAAKPWLWVNTANCTGKEIPGRSGPAEAGVVGYKLLVKAGDPSGHAEMDADRYGRSALGLAKPDDTTPLGVTANALVDATRDMSAFDVAGRIELPTHVVAFRPVIGSCADGTATCTALPAFTRQNGVSAKLKIQSTAKDFGAVKLHVRSRTFLERNQVDGPAPENTCVVAADLDRPVCDVDINGGLGHIPGKVAVEGSLRTNARVPDLQLLFKLNTPVADPTLYPSFGDASVTVDDDAHPAATGVRANSAGEKASLYRANLTGVDHDLQVAVRFQGVETFPARGRVCPDRDDVGRGPMDVGYVHADIDVGDATTLTANARIDERGRFAADLLSNTPVNGTVRAKIKNVAIGEKSAEEPGPFTDDVDLCVDLDLPFEVKFLGTTDARLGVDKTTWVMKVPTTSPAQKMQMRFGEQHQGTWLPGAVWFTHHAHFDPQSYGDWEWSSTGRRTLGLMPRANWNGIYQESFFKYTKNNNINTGNTFYDTTPGETPADEVCCVSSGATWFTIDIFWNQTIREDMFCRDNDDNCYPAMIGRPGFEFHKAVAQQGHTPPTALISFGELQTVSPLPTTSASFVFTWLAGSSPPEPAVAETVVGSTNVIQGLDGSKYRMFLGIDQNDAVKLENGDLDADEVRTVVSIGADYGNGTARWRRRVDLVDVGCGVHRKCRVLGSMTLLPAGYLSVTFHTEVWNDDNDPAHWVDEGGRTVLFDPSGFGSPAASSPVAASALVGKEVALSSPLLNPAIADLKLVKVWYFGDGSSLEQGAGVEPSVPAHHTYDRPGTYPAMIVYYEVVGDHTVRPLITMPVQVTVT